MSEEKAAAVSPLRQRMIEDMITRRFSGKTQAAHVRAVQRLQTFRMEVRESDGFSFARVGTPLGPLIGHRYGRYASTVRL